MATETETTTGVMETAEMSMDTTDIAETTGTKNGTTMGATTVITTEMLTAEV